MNQQNMVDQPWINRSAFTNSLGMWLMPWALLVLGLTYTGQPGVICLTPMAWLLAIPAGWNYAVFARGKPGRQPFVAGIILGAVLGLLYGMLFVGISAYTMPTDPGPENGISTQGLALIIVTAGTVFAALLSGLMVVRAASLQRRGKELPMIKVN